MPHLDNPSRSLSKTVGTSSQSVHSAADWQDIFFFHTGDAMGSLIVSIGPGGTAEDGSSSIEIPRSVSIGPIRLAPGTEVNAVSTAGSRRLNVIVSPVPYSEALLDQVAGFLKDFLFLARCMFPSLPGARE